MVSDARTRWRVEVRDNARQRIGICDVWTTLDATLRARSSGGWVINVPAGHNQAALFAEGHGVIVWAPWSVGQPWFSGPITELAVKLPTGTDPAMLTVTGIDDTSLLADRLVLPDPEQPLETQDTEAHYTFTGKAEGAIRTLVDLNAGSSALSSRTICDADPDGRLATPGAWVGSTVEVSARFDNLLTLCSALATPDRLRLALVQSGDSPDLLLSVDAPEDRSASVRLSQTAGTLTSGSATATAPRATHVLVAGSGEGTARAFTEVVDTAAATSWSRRIETFRDARDTADPATLTQRGLETLAEAAAVGGLSVEPVDLPHQAFGTHYGLGDTVALDIGITSWTEVVSAVTVKVSAAGQQITPILGDEQAAATPTPRIYDRVRDLTRRMDSLERRI